MHRYHRYKTKTLARELLYGRLRFDDVRDRFTGLFDEHLVRCLHVTDPDHYRFCDWLIANARTPTDEVLPRFGITPALWKAALRFIGL